MKRPLLFTFLLAIAPWAMGDMYIDKSIVTFEPGEAPRQDVRVSNSSEDVMYVQVEAFAAENPGAAEESRVRIANPQTHKLVASPNKLVVPAGGHKLVRILNLDPKSTKERVFRINITPIVPPLQEETSLLRIVVAYQVLTIIQPAEPHSKLEVSRTGNKVVFTNQGNTNVPLSHGRQCSLSDSETCEELTSQRLYAGNTWALDLPFDAPLT
ncbi:MAG: P pilus assembly chaperone PapD [Candidatus Azotimanducaceae bacterium]|jgi:P pilus assembly chaperone PapD